MAFTSLVSGFNIVADLWMQYVQNGLNAAYMSFSQKAYNNHRPFIKDYISKTVLFGIGNSGWLHRLQKNIQFYSSLR